MEVTDHGDIPEGLEEELQGCMVFRLDPLKAPQNETDNPMWTSGTSRDMDWLLTEE